MNVLLAAAIVVKTDVVIDVSACRYGMAGKHHA